MGSKYISVVKTNVPYDIVPMEIYPGKNGEILPKGAVITINLTPGYIVNLQSVGVVNSNSNVKTIQVEYRNSIGGIILGGMFELYQVNTPPSAPVINKNLPTFGVSQIIVTILELVDSSQNATVVISVKGCYGKYHQVSNY
jgi:hypothetical protein